MSPRVSTNTGYLQVLHGINFNQSRLVHAQNQAASGKRVLVSSDDPAAMSRAIQLTQRSSEALRAIAGIGAGLSDANLGASTLEDVSGIISEARVLVMQGLNGTLSDDDRKTLASQIELMREQLIDAGNFSVDGRYLFSGTATDRKPFAEETIGGHARVRYFGNDEVRRLRIGSEGEAITNVPGSVAFAQGTPTGASISSLTGIALGSSASSGSGIEYVALRHDATSAPTLGAVGVALVANGDGDTFLGDQTLVIDPVAGTIQLGDGAPVAIPAAGSTELADIAVENGAGGAIHLDLGAWTGAAYSGTVSGAGSFSLDGTTYAAIDFSATDQQVVHAATGAILHLDMTGVTRAGEDTVIFEGAVNVFDTLQLIADTLRDPEADQNGMLSERLSALLDELDHNHENALGGLGQLGSQSARMSDASSRLADLDVRVQGLIGDRMDADYSEIALELAKGQLSLQAVMATGSRMLQTSLVNFLR
jgi:flagellar hook-associated protein 3 FlgL